MTHGGHIPQPVNDKRTASGPTSDGQIRIFGEGQSAICSVFSLYNPYSSSVNEDLNISTLAWAASSGF